MDPALWEVDEHGDPRERVAVLLRLRPGAGIPVAVRAVARLGPIVTARVRRQDIVALRAHPGVESVKAARDARPQPGGAAARWTTHKVPAAVPRNPSWGRKAGPRGTGVVVGVVDWGVDFTHPDLLRRDDALHRVGGVVLHARPPP